MVLEYLATREIITSEHINWGPRPGVESLKASMLRLTEHADKQWSIKLPEISGIDGFHDVFGKGMILGTSTSIQTMIGNQPHILVGMILLEY
ncbi:hypothetical protein OROMI_012185 [Orobanche minor]